MRCIGRRAVTWHMPLDKKIGAHFHYAVENTRPLVEQEDMWCLACQVLIEQSWRAYKYVEMLASQNPSFRTDYFSHMLDRLLQTVRSSQGCCGDRNVKRTRNPGRCNRWRDGAFLPPVLHLLNYSVFRVHSMEADAHLTCVTCRT